MSFHLFDADTEQEGSLWPLEDPAGGGLPSIQSWRSWGHSWAAQGYDQTGLEGGKGRSTERIAGILHLPPHAIANESVSGSAVMTVAPTGFSRVLQRCVPASSHQQWPWQIDRFGVENCMWGVNDLGTDPFSNTGQFWAGQTAMWRLVWKNTMRSIISRFLAGGIYYATSTPGFPPAVWHWNGTQMAADFAFIPQGASGSGIGGWQFQLGSTANSGTGYWWTNVVGDKMIVTVPVDYDTGTVSLRHLCPGSWFDGSRTQYDSLGNVGGGAGTPQPGKFMRTGAEHPLSGTVSVVGGNINTTVNCAGLANRNDHNALGFNDHNPGAGVIGANSAMTHVSRHALTPVPGDTITLTVTVTSLPPGGWYGFDSFEVQAREEMRPIVVMNNVADASNWATIYGFAPSTTVWPFVSARAQEFSDDLAAVCAEFDDPGVMVADIRSKITAHQHTAFQLHDTRVLNENNRFLGDVVEQSSYGNQVLTGDGLHPHGLGQHDIVEAVLEAVADAGLPKGRGAMPFAPSRSLAYGRNT